MQPLRFREPSGRGPRGRKGRAAPRRGGRRLLALVLAAAGVGFVIGALIAAGEGESLDPARVVRAGAGEGDPFAYDPADQLEFEARAAAGGSHVLYALSPGGAVSSAERTSQFRRPIEAAAARSDTDPDLLEAIVFLESAGRPEAVAGPDPRSASGIAQIIPSTATELLGLKVDLPRSRRLTRAIERAAARGDDGRVQRLAAERARVDQRFAPGPALAAAGRYLEFAREQFGRDDLAVASYHMGIGNLEDVIRAYVGASDDGVPVRDLVAEEDLSYAQLYFGSSSLEHREASDLLAGFLDQSAEYYWKVLAAAEIMRLYREEPEELERLALLHQAAPTAIQVFHPPEVTELLAGPGDAAAALRDGELVPIPDDPSLGFILDDRVGKLGPRLGVEPELYRSLRPEALAALVYLASRVRAINGGEGELIVSAGAYDQEYEGLLPARDSEATPAYSPHATGWSFDVLRRYQSDEQAQAFQFTLDRLRSLAVLDYRKDGDTIHVAVSEGAEALLD